MAPAEVSDPGVRALITAINSTWGTMRTTLRFAVRDGKISRFETGQA